MTSLGMPGEFHVIWELGPGGAYELAALLITRYTLVGHSVLI